MNEANSIEQVPLRRLSAWQVKFDLLSKCAAVGLVFAIFISPTLTTITLIAAISFTVLAGNWKTKLNCIRQSKIVIPFVMFFLLVLIGMTYTTGPFHEALHIASRYKRFVLLLLLFPLFVEAKWRQAALISFLIAAGLTLICSYGNFFGLLPTFRQNYIPAAPFVSHINTSLMLSFAAFVLLLNYNKNPRFNWLIITAITLIVVNVLFVGISRFGYATLALFGCYYFWMRFRWRGLLTIVVSVSLLYALAFTFSSTFRHRVEQVYQNVVVFQQGQDKGPVTVRLYYASKALDIFKQHPLLGTGTGSFGHELSTMIKKPVQRSWPNGTNSDWFDMVAQYGAVGVIVLILFYYLIWHYGGMLRGNYRHIVRSLVLVTLVSSFPNEALMGSVSGNFFAIAMVILFASRMRSSITEGKH